MDSDDYFFDPDGNPVAKWRPSYLHWVPVGGDRGNSGRIKLAGEPIGPVAERCINGMEAIIELKRQRELLANPRAATPSTPRDAVLQYFGLPRLDEIPSMDPDERREMYQRINAVRGKLAVHLAFENREFAFLGATNRGASRRDLGGDQPSLVGQRQTRVVQHRLLWRPLQRQTGKGAKRGVSFVCRTAERDITNNMMFIDDRLYEADDKLSPLIGGEFVRKGDLEFCCDAAVSACAGVEYAPTGRATARPALAPSYAINWSRIIGSFPVGGKCWHRVLCRIRCRRVFLRYAFDFYAIRKKKKLTARILLLHLRTIASHSRTISHARHIVDAMLT